MNSTLPPPQDILQKFEAAYKAYQRTITSLVSLAKCHNKLYLEIPTWRSLITLAYISGGEFVEQLDQNITRRAEFEEERGKSSNPDDEFWEIEWGRAEARREKWGLGYEKARGGMMMTFQQGRWFLKREFTQRDEHLILAGQRYIEESSENVVTTISTLLATYPTLPPAARQALQSSLAPYLHTLRDHLKPKLLFTYYWFPYSVPEDDFGEYYHRTGERPYVGRNHSLTVGEECDVNGAVGRMLVWLARGTNSIEPRSITHLPEERDISSISSSKTASTTCTCRDFRPYSLASTSLQMSPTNETAGGSTCPPTDATTTGDSEEMENQSGEVDTTATACSSAGGGVGESFSTGVSVKRRRCE